eukprot:3097854-Rhodomonas_salina.1
MENQRNGADPMLTESRIGRGMAPFLDGMSNVVKASLDIGTAGLAHPETQAGRVINATNKFGASNVAPQIAAGAAAMAAAGASGGVPPFALVVGPAGGVASAILAGGALQQTIYTMRNQTTTHRGNRVRPSNTDESLSALVSPRPRSQNSSQSSRRERGHRDANSTQRHNLLTLPENNADPILTAQNGNTRPRTTQTGRRSGRGVHSVAIV